MANPIYGSTTQVVATIVREHIREVGDAKLEALRAERDKLRGLVAIQPKNGLGVYNA